MPMVLLESDEANASFLHPAGKSMLGKSKGKSMLAKSKEKSMLAKSKGKSILAKSKGKSMLAKSKEKSMLGKSKGKSMLAKSNENTMLAKSKGFKNTSYILANDLNLSCIDRQTETLISNPINGANDTNHGSSFLDTMNELDLSQHQHPEKR